MEQLWLSVIIFFTTSILFLCEAMIHFNIGKSEQDKTKIIVFPSGKEFGYIVLTVMIFSLLNSVAVWGIGKLFPQGDSISAE